MPGNVRVGGTWREISQPSVRVGGVWRNVEQAWTRVGGVWREWFSGTAMTLITTQTLTNSTTATISLTSIPNTFRDLVLVFSGNGSSTATATGQLHLRFNSSSTTIYHQLFGYNNSNANIDQTQATIGDIQVFNGVGSTAAHYAITVFDYATASRHKQLFSRGSFTQTNQPASRANVWRSTTAVSSIQLFITLSPASTFREGTTVSLYGVKA
jgi:hypothetical protein